MVEFGNERKGSGRREGNVYGIRVEEVGRKLVWDMIFPEIYKTRKSVCNHSGYQRWVKLFNL